MKISANAAAKLILEKGWSLAQAAQKAGVSRDTLKARLIEAGYTFDEPAMRVCIRRLEPECGASAPEVLTT